MAHTKSKSAGDGKRARVSGDIRDSGWWPARAAARVDTAAGAVESDAFLEWPEGQATALIQASSLGGLEEVEEVFEGYWTPVEDDAPGEDELATPAGMEIPPPLSASRRAEAAPIAQRPVATPTSKTADTDRRKRFTGLISAVVGVLAVGTVAVWIARIGQEQLPAGANFQPVTTVEATAAADVASLLHEWTADADKSRQASEMIDEVSAAVQRKVATLPLLLGDQTLAALTPLAPDEGAANEITRRRMERAVAALTVSVQPDGEVLEGFAEVASDLSAFADKYPQTVGESVDKSLDFDTADSVRYELAKAFEGTSAAEVLNRDRVMDLYDTWRARLRNGGALDAFTFLKPRLAQRGADTLFARQLPDAVTDVTATSDSIARPFMLAALRDVYHTNRALARTHASALEDAVLASLRDQRDGLAETFYRERSADIATVPAPRFLVDVLQSAARSLPLRRQLAMYSILEEDAAFSEQQVIADHRSRILAQRTRQAIAEGTFLLDALQWQSDVTPDSYGDLLRTVFPVVEEAVSGTSIDRNGVQALIRQARAADDTELAARLTAIRDRRWPPKTEEEAPTETAERIPEAAKPPAPARPSVNLQVTGPAEGQTKITVRLLKHDGQPVANGYVQVQLSIGAAKAHSFVAQTNGEGVAEFNVTRYIVTTRELPESMQFTYRVNAVDMDAKSYERSVSVGELVERFW